MKGKVAMITGASVGIGRAVALKMAAEGVRLVLLDINATTQHFKNLKKNLKLLAEKF